MDPDDILVFCEWKRRLAEDAIRRDKLKLLDLIPMCILRLWHSEGREPTVEAVSENKAA